MGMAIKYQGYYKTRDTRKEDSYYDPKSSSDLIKYHVTSRDAKNIFDNDQLSLEIHHKKSRLGVIAKRPQH